MPGLMSAAGSYNVNPSVYPDGATPVIATSGDVAAASAVATIPAVALKTNYITGFSVTGTGATGAATVAMTLAGLLGGTITYNIVAVAGATLANPQVHVSFPYPLPASAVNTAIVLTCPSLGAGNLHNIVTVYGFVV